MTFHELPQEWQKSLLAEKEALRNKVLNTPYNVELYSANGLRYFKARRMCKASTWAGFGNGSYWRISYGKVSFITSRNPVGEKTYELCNGKRFAKSANGTIIPNELNTKKEVIALARAIGIFNI